MKQPLLLFPFLSLFMFYACNNASTMKPETTKNDSIIKDTSPVSSLQKPHLPSINENGEDTVTNIKFAEFAISIVRYVSNGAVMKMLTNIQKDTVYLSPAEIGETIEGQKISISSNLLSNLTIEQSYETSVSFSNEGEHLTLTDWKHFYSDWKQLKPNGKAEFVCAIYTDQEREKFPKININELKEYVKDKFGMGWYGEMFKIKLLGEYPSEVWISRYFLKISGQLKTNGQIITKIIIVDFPVGC